MSDFVPHNRNLREVLIFFFHPKRTAAEAHRELQKVYGDAALSETTCHDWFRRFKYGDFDVDENPREGRPKTFKDAIDAFEPSTARKMSTIRAESQKSDSTA